MRYCPSCRKPTVQVSGACPHCGADLDGAPAGPADQEKKKATYSGLSGVESEPEGALELDIAPPQARYTPLPGSDLELEDEGGGHAAPPMPRATPTRPPSTPMPRAAPTRPPSAPPARPSLSTEPDPPDPFDVDRLTGYGPAPSSPFAAPGYALRVRKRTGELVVELERLERTFAEADREHTEALARLGERARAAGYSSPGADPLIAAVDAAESQAAGALDAAAGERALHKSRLATIQGSIEAVNTRLVEPRQVEARLAGALAAKEQEQRVVADSLARVEATIRSEQAAVDRAADADENAEGADDLVRLGTEARARLPGLTAQRETLRTQVAQLDEPVAELRSELGLARAELEAISAERKALIDEREAERKRHEAAVRQAASETTQLGKLAEDRLATVGMAVRLDAPDEDWARELFASIDQRLAKAAKLRRELVLHRTAIKAHDEPTVKRGYALMAAAAALALLGALGLIVLVAVLT